jgi:pyruvate dehydrogenase E2 component (dihydrolipoamide acetyltransferase)
MSLTQVTVPDLGGIDEVEVIEITIKVGDQVDAEQEIIVLESDKATMEVPAPMAGKVAEILVSVGDKVSSGTPVVMMEIVGESAEKISSSVPAETEAVKASEGKASEGIAETVTAAASSHIPGATVTEVDIKVPDLGGADAVEVIEFSVQAGETIEAEESLLVLESDKATMEVPAPQSGTILSFAISLGDKVSEGDVIGKMRITNSQPAVSQAAVSQGAVSQGAVPSPILADKKVEKAQPVALTSKESASVSGKVHAGPAVRQLARELGVELPDVSGSGPRSRITKDDVQEFVKARLKQPIATTHSMGVVGSDEDFSRFGPIEHVPLNKIKQVTAKNMVKSWSTIPQVTQFDEADITELELYRKGAMAAMLPEGVKVSPLAFVLKACVMALKKFPQFNSSLNIDGTALVSKQYYNLGVAVETPDGLLVPVIKNAETKSIVDFATESAELAGKARNKKLPMDGMMGGTFTISSLGGIGGTAFTPIVAAPQVAILGVSKASYKPVWNGTEFEPRLILPLSLSYDHRVVDGAEAARFARYLCMLLSDTRHMLL